ncbi:MAG: prepilin-type N-terminal cleavage/methylation domain-containing protein [Phycisphaerae bacterium]|nr:prepilin-type N-terminal cleavage/methylation domain-containing protein [Phycisphaerae bacterium]
MKPVSHAEPGCRWRRPLLAICGIIFLVAAVGKALDPFPLVRVLDYLFYVPGPNHAWTVIPVLALVGTESALALLLIMAPTRLVARSAAALLVMFTAMLTVLALNPGSPPCGCFGGLGFANTGRGEFIASITRNLAMVVVLVSVPGITRDAGAPVDKAPHRATREATNPARAFTLVELLVCVVVAAVLVALVVPALATSRDAARLTASLSIQRGLASGVSAYAAESRDAFPYIQDPGEFSGWITLGGRRYRCSYFGATRFWVNVLSQRYIDAPRSALETDPEQSIVANAAHAMPPEIIRSCFELMYGAFAAPPYWDEDEPPNDLSLLRAVRLPDVRFPSGKGLAIDTNSGWFRRWARDPAAHAADSAREASMSFCDGSASVRQLHQDPARLVDRTEYMQRRLVPVLQTRHGIHGRDY